MTVKPIIAVAGLSCETSTFTPSRTQAPAFHPKRGDGIFDENPHIRPGNELGDAAEWHGAVTGHALPGGMVTRAAFEELAAEIITTSLTHMVDDMHLDGLWFDIHGNMCVEGIHDAKAELLRRIRKVVGPHTVVSASMDLHGNFSRELAHQTDLITCYRIAPHIDEQETRERACRNLLDLLSRQDGPRRPYKVWIPIPILLPGEQTSTRLEPAKHIYEAVHGVDTVEGAIDTAVWVGYAWADEPRNRAVVMTTGWDKKAVSEGAERLAKLFWAAHQDFMFVAPTWSFKECLDTALLPGAKHPYFISDSGDNPAAGGSGDVSLGLIKLLARQEFKEEIGPVVIYASLPGPEAVKEAVEAGIGRIITVTGS